MKLAKARNTTKAYAFAWQVFCRWCAEVRHTPLPATEETVSDFVLWCLYERERRYRLATVDIAAAMRRAIYESARPAKNRSCRLCCGGYAPRFPMVRSSDCVTAP